MKTRHVDLSHTIEEGLITYKGLPAPIICDFLSREDSRSHYDEGTEFQIGKIEMISNTGTYIDCPFHRYADGDDLSQVTLDKFANIESVTIRHDYVEKGLAVDVGAFQNLDLAGKAVLINTNWSKHWRTDQYFEDHAYVTAQAAEFLKNAQARLVGIDSYNIDNTKTRLRPVHSILLRHNILIVEHLTNLHTLPDKDFRFSAVPPKIKGMGTFPVRAFAEVF
jgi:arylformamidase